MFTIVGFPSDVREVILGEFGVLKSLKPGGKLQERRIAAPAHSVSPFGVSVAAHPFTLSRAGIIVDMTTSEPSLAQEIAAAASTKGVASIDAPVSGGDIGAREARLSIMVGGTFTQRACHH